MGNCNGGDCSGCSCDGNSSLGDNYITGLSVFDRRENELSYDDVDCEFKLDTSVYNPNTKEYGVISGYRKKLGSTFVVFEITGIYSKNGETLFTHDNVGESYCVEPCFIVRDREEYERENQRIFFGIDS